MKFNIRETLFRIWYGYVSRIDKNAEVIFMNYGFSDPGVEIPLDSNDSPNRYSVQMYHHLASATSLSGKEVVEIGCGRGGGLKYVFKKFSPATAKGVDLEHKAVAFCNNHYQEEGLSFMQGDAQSLSLPDSSCDVVINVESSHRYPNFDAFLGEVTRILRPNGYFLFTDFRYDTDMKEFEESMSRSGFVVLKKRNINKEVIAALDLDDARRRKLVRKLIPRFLHSIALNFAGAVGSPTYNHFLSGRYVYFSYILQRA